MSPHSFDTTLPGYTGMNTEEGGLSIDTDKIEVASRIDAIIGRGGRISGSITNPERTKSLEIEFQLRRPISASGEPVEVAMTTTPAKVYHLVPIHAGREFLVVDRKNRDRGIFIPNRKVA